MIFGLQQRFAPGETGFGDQFARQFEPRSDGRPRMRAPAVGDRL
jgi:hypothetical protein